MERKIVVNGDTDLLQPVWGKPLIDYPMMEVMEYLAFENQKGQFYFSGDQEILRYLDEKFNLSFKLNQLPEKADIIISMENVLMTATQPKMFNNFDLEVTLKVIGDRIRRALKKAGVKLIDSHQTYVDSTVEISPGTLIYPNCYIRGKTKIGCNVIIEPGVILWDSTVENDVTIKAYSYIEDALIKKNAQIGPFARIRPKVQIGEQAKIGNFVEIKKSTIEDRVKVSHLSYVGDAVIGEDSNIGCGFITCNYDGKDKHLTKIGKRTFVGSDTQTIAPVEIGSDCFIASGSTITENMPDESFAISRGRQITKEKMAKKYLK